MSQCSRKQVRLRNAPLIEAVCEFRFKSLATPINLITGLIYEKVKAEYPEIQMQKGVVVSIEKNKEVSVVSEERTVFKDDSRNRLVQVGSTMIAVNQLEPYVNYKSFRGDIEKHLRHYKEIAKPREIARIGLRYINRIEIPKGKTLDAVFEIGFKIPEDSFPSPSPFLLRFELSYNQGRDKLILILSQPSNLEKNAIMLDLDYVLVKPEEIEEKDTLLWVDSAHEKIELTFQSCITEYGWKCFEPEEE